MTRGERDESGVELTEVAPKNATLLSVRRGNADVLLHVREFRLASCSRAGLKNIEQVGCYRTRGA
jgi:hypothetical protein